MKTITKTFNVYKIEELKAVNESGYKKALDDLRYNYDFYFEYEELLNGFNSIADHFDVKVSDYCIGIYDYHNHVDINIDGYMDLSNAKKNTLVKQLNEILADQINFDMLFSGTYTDNYFIDYFKVNEIVRVSYNDLHKHLINAFNHALFTFIADLERFEQNDDNFIEIAQENEYEYLSDGTLYSVK